MEQCSFCGGSLSLGDVKLILRDRLGALTKIIECQQCHCMGLVDLKNINYDSSEILNKQIKIHDLDWKDENKSSLNKYLNDLNSLQPFLKGFFNNGQLTRICEVGSGRGGLIRSLLDSGYCNVIGCEPSEFLYNLAIKHYGIDDNLFHCTSDELFRARVKDKFDCIIYWHALEHIPKALDELKNAATMLDVDGCILIQIPMLFERWIYSEHLHFINENTLRYVESQTNLVVKHLSVDYSHMFMTIAFSLRNSGSKSILKNELYIEGNTIDIIVQHYNRAIVELIDDRYKLNEFIKDKVLSECAYEKLVDDKIKTIAYLEESISSKESEIKKLVRDSEILSNLLNEKLETEDAYSKLVKEKIDEISKLEMLLKDKEEEIYIISHEKIRTEKEYEKLVNEKIDTINALEAIIQQKK